MAIKDILSKKTILILCAVLLVYTLVGFFLLPLIGKNILKDQLSKSLNRDVTIEKVYINPYTLSAQIDALSVNEDNTDIFFSAEKIYANINFLSLLVFNIVVSDISLENPYANIIKNKDNTFNFSDLLANDTNDINDTKDSKPSDQSKEIFEFVINNISVTGGKVKYIECSDYYEQHWVMKFIFS
jgi:uncharacterized protein involved in outer membrane biogenesis